MVDIKQCPVCGEKDYITGSKCFTCGYDNSMERQIQYLITMSKDGTGTGTVSGVTNGDKYSWGHRLDLTATAAGGSEFIKWTIDGNEYTDNPIVVMVLKARTIVATFNLP